MGSDAQRFHHCVVHEIGAKRDSGTLHLVGRARVVAKAVGHATHVALGLAHRLAHIAAFEFGEVVAVGIDHIGQPEQKLPALERCQRRPGPVPCRVGRCHRRRHIRRPPARNSGDHLFGRGVDGFETLAR